MAYEKEISNLLAQLEAERTGENDPAVLSAITGAINVYRGLQKDAKPEDPKETGPRAMALSGDRVLIIDPSKPDAAVVKEFPGASKPDVKVTVSGNYVIATDAAGKVVGREKVDPNKADTPQDAPITAEDRASVRNQQGAAANASNAQAALAATTAANQETPAERRANIYARADAEARAAIQAATGKVAAGVEMKEEDRLKLQNTLATILAKTQQELKTQADEEAFEREKPFKQGQQAVSERQVAATERNAATAHEQNVIARERAASDQRKADLDRLAVARKDAAGVLQEQGKGFMSGIDSAVKAGVAPTMGVVSSALDPFAQAFALINEGVRSGQVAHSAVPTPKAPVPPGGTPVLTPQLAAPRPGGPV